MRSANQLAAALILVGVSSVQAGQYRWEDDFSHNNAALYTNLNGGPSNLTIKDGFARFGGDGGAYYGRPDFTAFSSGHPKMTFHTGLEAQILGSGVVGIGWYSPLHQTGISLVVDPRGTPTMSMLQHNGFGSTTVLASVSIIFGKNFAYMSLMHDEEGSNVWVAQWVPFGGTSQQLVMFGAPQLIFGEDSHFMMYGNDANGMGPGQIDWVYGAAPEPSTIVLLLVGVGYVAVRRRKRSRT